MHISWPIGSWGVRSVDQVGAAQAATRPVSQAAKRPSSQVAKLAKDPKLMAILSYEALWKWKLHFTFADHSKVTVESVDDDLTN